MNALPARITIGLALVVASAAASFLLGGLLEVSLIVTVVGAAAVLIAANLGGQSEAAEPAPSDGGTAVIGETIEAVVEPMLILRAGRVIVANPAARTLLGRHIVGEDVRVAIRHPAAADRLVGDATGDMAPINLVGLGARDQRWEMHVADLSGGLRLVHLIDQTGSYAAERMRVDFVANASHELRTPLASVLGYVETLRDTAGEDPAIRQRFLKIIDDEARRMERLVEDLMSLSRIEAEKFRVPADRIDLAQLVAEVCAELADGHDGRGADLSMLAGDPAPTVVTGDRSQLSQLLHNLVGNAIKYGRRGTPVTIALAATPGTVKVTVEDEGDGIAAEHLPRLTERFYRAEPSRSRAMGGTGLGLAIVKHIVERHRGRLDIASTVGVGTRVTVSLPAAGAGDAVIKA